MARKFVMAFLFKEMLTIFLVLSFVNGYKLPGSCDAGQYYEPSLLDCIPCRTNASLVTSEDGFGCACDDHSVAVGINRCKPCNITEVVSTDGSMCVSRRCQSSAGRIVCRKCPNDYISVTQNFDGSPMKEVQCIKCARGYKALKNICVKCEACTCNKNEIIVKGKCIPKKFVLDRPKYAVNELHPDELLEIVKLEYLCTQQDVRACRALSSACVRNFYTSDLAGPCKLWLQSNVTGVQGLPLLTIDESKISEYKIYLERGQDTLKIALGIHKRNGKFELIQDTSNNQDRCLSRLNFKIGENIERHCSRNISNYKSEYEDVLELYLFLPSKRLLPLPITLLKPNHHYVEKAAWSSNKFRKFFLITSYLSTTTNTTNTVYLQTLLFRVRLERSTSLRFYLDIEARYSTKSHFTDLITTYVKVEHDMPSAGVLRSLEIWGGVLGSLMTLYALIQWRGVVRRGGLYIALVPISLNCVADALYCATIISTLHALAAEAGTLELTLPLSQVEEHVIQWIIYTVVVLKVVKILWVTWNQCRCDIFFIDWSKYNPPTIDFSVQQKSNNWKIRLLVREWTSMQTIRRVSPGFTAMCTLLILHILNIWDSYIPKSYGYKWVIATIVWWSSYTILLCIRLLLDKLFGSTNKRLLKLCTDLELSLIVFQEEFYAHYVDGRNEDLMGFRSNSNPLQTCRIICSSQLRTVYRKLANTVNFGDFDRNQDLLSKFLGAFFERSKRNKIAGGASFGVVVLLNFITIFSKALDGLSWVASERTLLEKLLDVELITREGGNTSVLLYDTDITTPSCFAVTWLGEEWLLATFDAMLFGCVLILTGQHLVATLVTLIVWQIMKFVRVLFGSWNLRNKIGREN